MVLFVYVIDMLLLLVCVDVKFVNDVKFVLIVRLFVSVFEFSVLLCEIELCVKVSIVCICRLRFVVYVVFFDVSWNFVVLNDMIIWLLFFCMFRFL